MAHLKRTKQILWARTQSNGKSEVSRDALLSLFICWSFRFYMESASRT